jgi:hypothetical protein
MNSAASRPVLTPPRPDRLLPDPGKSRSIIWAIDMTCTQQEQEQGADPGSVAVGTARRVQLRRRQGAGGLGQRRGRTFASAMGLTAADE